MHRLQSRYDSKGGRTKNRLRLIELAFWVLLSIGAVSLIVSIVFVSQIFALIGICLVFWGAILLYIQPEEYTKKVLLDAVTPNYFETLNQIVNELDFRGKAIYLPPKYFGNPETDKVYLPKQLDEKPPEPNLILQQENKFFFLDQPEGIMFTPPGAHLIKLFEKKMGINFAFTNLQDVIQNLPKLLIEDLEIAENLEINIKPSEMSAEETGTNYGIIHVKITNSLFKKMVKENPKLSQIFNTIGTPLTSAIAGIFAKVTGKPLIIDNIRSYKDGNIVEVTYKIESLEYAQISETTVADNFAFVHPKFSLKPIGLSLIISGVLVLIWVGILSLYEVSVWDKDLGFIFFAYRTGEPIDLGLGMKLIHYVMFGSALLMVGIFTYLQKNTKLVRSLIRPPIFPRLINLILIVLGTFMLIWISELMCYEIIVWQKSLNFVLFTYGAGEPIDLGIGMKVIHYLVISISLLLLGALNSLFINRNVAKISNRITQY